MDYCILSYGASADGRTDNASFIQAAVDDAAENGGGRVVVPPGRFCSGSVLLKSHVELHLEKGAVLVSSLREDEIASFPAPKGQAPIDGWNGGFFLGARDAEDILLSGSGTIEGQGEKVFTDDGRDSGFHECPLACASFRPRLLLFENITDLEIRGITLKDAAFWTLHMAGCRRVFIHHIRILNNDRGANNDGIDPDCCRDVMISDCFVETGDDAIVLKSTAPMARRYGPCENITIRGCVLHSRDSALKIGTETHGTIRRVIFADSVVRDCSRGVGIWVRDGGTVEDIQVHHLTGGVRRYADAYERPGSPGWWGKGEPIFVSAVFRKDSTLPSPGIIHRLSFSDISLDCESSLFLGGERESVIRDVCFRAIRLRFVRQGTQKGGLFDEQPSGRHVYPHAVPAVYARWVDGLSLTESSVRFLGEDEAWDGSLTETENCTGTDIRWDRQ